jgi:hypothetical protein
VPAPHAPRTAHTLRPDGPASVRLRRAAGHLRPTAAAAIAAGVVTTPSSSALPPPSPADHRLPPAERDGDAESRELFRQEFPTEAFVAPENEKPGDVKWFCCEAAARTYVGGFARGANVDDMVSALYRDGFVVLRDFLDVEFVDQCADAFDPQLAAHVASLGDDPENRGPQRHSLPLDVDLPFAQLAEHKRLHELLARLLGADPAMVMMSSDTPMGAGSVFQSVHLDGGAAAVGPFGEREGELAEPEGVAGHVVFNFPLVDVDERNGPLEISAGSHRYPLASAHRRILDGSAPLERVLMCKGDCLIRDLRCLHRGSPNLTETPRPNFTAIFAEEAEDGKAMMSVVPRNVLEGLGPEAQRLLRSFGVSSRAAPAH